MIQLTGEKMAKSAGNIAPLHEVVEQYGAETVVMYLVSGHYRQPLAFSDEALQQARANVRRIREAARQLRPGPTGSRDPAHVSSFREAFFAALANDFNTSAALAQLNEWLRAAGSPRRHRQRRAARDAHGARARVAARPARQAPADVVELAQERMAVRSLRDFAAADRLREQIEALGWEVRDVADGFELLPL